MSTDQTGLTEEDLWTQVMSGKQAEQDDAVKEEGSPAEVEETKQESEPVEPDQGKKIDPPKAVSLTVEEYENLKREHEHLKSLVGRLPQFQSQLAQAQKRLSELGNVGSVYNAPDKKQPQQTVEDKEKADEFLDSQVFKTIEQEWPDLAATLKSQHSLTKKEVTELKSLIDKLAKSGPGNDRLERIERQLEEREFSEKVNHLTTKHPDWKEHVSFNARGNFSHMSKDFAQFWFGLPQDLRESFDPESLDDSIALMDHFKEQMTVEKRPIQETKQKEASMKRNAAPQVRGVLPVTATEDLTKLNPEDAWVLVSKSSSNPYA